MKAERLLVVAMGLLMVGVACVPTAPATTAVSPTAYVPPALPTATPLVVPPTPTAEVPTVAPTAVPSVAPTALPSEPTSQRTQFFLIALEDNGQSGPAVGCGDSLIPVAVDVPAGADPLRVALEALLAVHEAYYGESGLYNALYQSELTVEAATIEAGQAVVHLSGTMMLGGVCDNPRVQAQIEETARQFSPTGQVAVFVNDVPLADLLSLQG